METTTEQELTFELTCNGDFVYRGTENDCYMKLQKVQSQSADWAMKYEGYKIEPEKVFIFDNLTDVYNAADSQLTIQDLLNQRIYLKGRGWSTIIITREFRNYIAENISDRLGGRGNTKEVVKNALQRQYPPQHWGLARFTVERYGDSKPRIGYIAGQDSTWEYKEIRTYLKNI